MSDLILTGVVNGIARTENVRWPAELERLFGLKGFKAYDTEHGFTTLILPTGYGVIVRVGKNGPEAGFDKGDPAFVGHMLLSHACRRMDPLKMEDGQMSTGSHVCIEKMNTPEQRLMLESFKTVNYKDVVYTVGYIDMAWAAEQVNDNPELLDGFRF